MTTALELSTYLQTLPPDTTIEVLSVDSSTIEYFKSIDGSIPFLRIGEK